MEPEQGNFPPISTQNAVDRSNLTELQWLYWVGQTLRPTAPLFNNVLSFTLNGALDWSLLQECFADFIAGSTTMRTVIINKGQQPSRYILPHPPTSLALLDFSRQQNPAAAAAQWQKQQAQSALQMDKALYDAALLKIGPEEHIWYLNQHHLITDATSIFLVFEAVTALYQHRVKDSGGARSPLPDFDKFFATRRKQQSSRRAEKATRFWRQKLDPPPPPLVMGDIIGHKNGHRTRRITRTLSPEKSAAILALARETMSGTTIEQVQTQLFAMLLLVLLHQLSGNVDLGFITTIHNRPTAVLRQTLGPLMEICPFRIPLDPEENFQSLQKKVNAELQSILIHFRFSRGILTHLNGFDVMLNTARRPALEFNGQPVGQEIIHHNSGSEQLALHVHYLEESDSFELYFDLHADIFSANRGPIIADHFITLLDSLLENPHQPLHTLEKPPAGESYDHSHPQNRQNGAVTVTETLSPLEKQLQIIWQTVLQIEPIGIHDNFFDLGGESWQAMQLLLEVEKISKKHLPFTVLLNGSTISEMARILHVQQNDDTLITLQPGSNNVQPLFYFPGAAGNILTADRLRHHLPAEQPIYTFLFPGLAEGTTPREDIPALAADFCTALRKQQPRGPYWLLGYSAGSIIALETAQQLIDAGETVAFLGAIDMPIQPPRFRFWKNSFASLSHILGLSRKTGENLFLRWRDNRNRLFFYLGLKFRLWLEHNGRRLLHFLQDDSPSRKERLRQYLQQHRQDEPRQAAPIIMDMDDGAITDPQIKQLFRVTDRAVRLYVPRRFPATVTLFRSEPHANGRPEILSPRYDNGWGTAAAGVTIIELPIKRHLAIMQEPGVRLFAAALQEQLARCRSGDHQNIFTTTKD